MLDAAEIFIVDVSCFFSGIGGTRAFAHALWLELEVALDD